MPRFRGFKGLATLSLGHQNDDRFRGVGHAISFGQTDVGKEVLKSFYISHIMVAR